MSDDIIQLNEAERLNREIKRRTKIVGAFPDGAKRSDVGMCSVSSCGRH